MQAAVVLRRAAIHTMDRAQPLARSVAIGGGRILAVSLDDDLDELIGPGTRVLDIPNSAVVPGFVDAHIHFGAPGMDADLVVLAPDPFDLEPAAVRETPVELTMVGGRVTYEGGT